ncbi:MAG TPA: HD-GYP domain-containing protein [Gaiellaceae bacterium]|nr:HD-GYP domain-containing protein [Gaiellaceae bacterium]
MTSVTSDQRVELEALVEESRERVARSLRGRDRSATVIGAAGFLAVALPLALLAQTDRSSSLAVVALLVAAFALVSRVEFEIGAGSAIPTQLVFVPMLFVVPARIVPLCVALGLVLGALPEVRRSRMHGERLLVQLVSSWHAVGPAVVMIAAGEPTATLSAWPVLALALATQIGLDFAIAAARERVVYGISPRELAAAIGSVYAVDVVLTPMGLAIAVATVGEPVVAAFLGLPLVALLSVFARERQRRIDHALELSHAYRGTAFLLGDVVEADDAYTGSHSRDVVELSLGVADELGVTPRERRHTELAALLHDVGKIRIPNEIINKPGPLTPDERRVIETHTVEGELLLAKVGGLLGEVGTIVRSCHERHDGKGYPDGLAGDEIPLAARIVSACDAYHAITTDRPYRAARSCAEALVELRAGSGAQFDPRVVDALVGVVSRAA